MNKQGLTFAVLFAVLLLLQIIIFDNLVLFNSAVCFIFIYFILSLPLNFSTNWLLTLAFLSGLTVDIFCDTPGVNALSATVLAILKRPLFFAYVPRDDKSKSELPGIDTTGLANYSKYMLTASAVYCALNFSLEFFNLAEIGRIALLTGCSTLFTFTMLLAVDCLIMTKGEKRL